MQALLALGESGHQVADHQDQARQELGEKPAGGAAEPDSPAGEVRDDEAARHLKGALALSHAIDERFYLAELLRLRGEIALRGAGPDRGTAEAAFREAIEIARGQAAKSLELRAATSLARLWRDRGKRSEARDLLAPMYAWFSEGFDTLDLIEAKALLEGLGA